MSVETSRRERAKADVLWMKQVREGHRERDGQPYSKRGLAVEQ